jgi:hypothetical protein
VNQDRRPERPDLGNREQVRRLKRAMDRAASEVIRCQDCGHQQHAEAAFIGPATRCEQCSSALHSCRHCLHFDTRHRHQCRKPVDEPVPNKAAANKCPVFEPRLVLDATGKRLHGEGKQDAKALFDSLFKKG